MCIRDRFEVVHIVFVRIVPDLLNIHSLGLFDQLVPAVLPGWPWFDSMDLKVQNPVVKKQFDLPAVSAVFLIPVLFEALDHTLAVVVFFVPVFVPDHFAVVPVLPVQPEDWLRPG